MFKDINPYKFYKTSSRINNIDKYIMKTTFTTTDDYEAMRIFKSLDMALALFQIQFNLKKKCEYRLEADEDIEEFDVIFEELNDIFNEYDIDAAKLLQ